jgi:SdrD B-like domain
MLTRPHSFALMVFLVLISSGVSLAGQKVKTKSNIKNDRVAEATIGGVEILLAGVGDSDAVTKTTNASGCATFSGLQSGEYKVSVSDFSMHLIVGRESKMSLCLVSSGDGADLMMNRKNYVGHVTLMK